jgi:uncharacterized membrane protein YiaA
MNKIGDEAGGNGRANTKASALWAWLALLVGISIYAYVRLSTNKAVMPMAIVLLCVLEVAQFARAYKESKKVEAWTDAASVLVLLLVCVGVYRHSIATHPTFIFATVFYRPFYTRYCHRRLALVLALLIICAVLPAICGIVRDPDSISVLAALYALLVATLWVFCSKLGATIFGFEPGG